MTKIIAITGGSGVGKTTVARALARKLGAGAVVIAEDDYYRCSSTIANFDAATYNFDAPEAKEHALLRNHLALAKSGEAFDKPVYDLVTHRRKPEVERIVHAAAADEIPHQSRLARRDAREAMLREELLRLD